MERRASEGPYGLLRRGAWVGAIEGGLRAVVDPGSEEILGDVPFGGRVDAEVAIENAAAALPGWSRATAYERARVLAAAAGLVRSRLERLAPVTVAESGKPLAEATGEWRVVADLFEWFAEEGKRAYGRLIPSRRSGRRHLVLRQPIGVVGVITAWNFPAYNPARSWAAALAAGCTVVARPSELTPLSAMELAALLVEAGLPAGALELVNGDPASQAEAMLEDPRCRKISFTGSQRVGRILMDGASRSMTRLSLELGGNAPVLVGPDVDVEAFARAAVGARFRNAGQVCVAPQRFLVHERLYGTLVGRLIEPVGALRVGPGRDPASQVGPLITAAHRDRVQALVEGARSAGAELLAGGRRPARLERGHFLDPALLAGARPGMGIFDEEVFGPVLPLTPFADWDEAIALANATEHGLAAYVFTRDLGAATRAWERLEFGMVAVNDWVPHAVEGPFSGWKASGQGTESGAEGLAEYLETKLVGIGGLDD